MLGSLAGAILRSIDVEKEQKEMRGRRRGADAADSSCGRDWLNLLAANNRRLQVRRNLEDRDSGAKK